MKQKKKNEVGENERATTDLEAAWTRSIFSSLPAQLLGLGYQDSGKVRVLKRVRWRAQFEDLCAASQHGRIGLIVAIRTVEQASTPLKVNLLSIEMCHCDWIRIRPRSWTQREVLIFDRGHRLLIEVEAHLFPTRDKTIQG
jgi:hypothetical protein